MPVHGRQGCYGKGRITILTPYTGQLQILRKLLRSHVLVSLAEADAEVRALKLCR